MTMPEAVPTGHPMVTASPAPSCRIMPPFVLIVTAKAEARLLASIGTTTRMAKTPPTSQMVMALALTGMPAAKPQAGITMIAWQRIRMNVGRSFPGVRETSYFQDLPILIPSGLPGQTLPSLAPIAMRRMAPALGLPCEQIRMGEAAPRFGTPCATTATIITAIGTRGCLAGMLAAMFQAACPAPAPLPYTL